MTRRPDAPNQCNSADYSPGVSGHKCIKIRHPRTETHHCECEHEWMEPTDVTQ